METAPVCGRGAAAGPAGAQAAGEDTTYIGGSDTLPPPLSRDEEAELIARLDGGDEGVKSQLIERNLRLVVYIARRFENTGVGIEDLISIGTIGLIKAINTYQPAKNIKLATYASRCIENEILMHLRKTANLKSEVSFDEPLNTDWDGNELLLSDILGTESVSADEAHRGGRGSSAPLRRAWRSWRTGSGRSSPCASAWTAARSAPRRRWPTGWVSPSPTSRAWKSASSAGSSGRFCGCCARAITPPFHRPARRAAGFVNRS